MKYEIVKPRKIVWVMRDFINSAHDLTYEYGFVLTSPRPDTDDVDTLLNWFATSESETIYEKRQVKIVSSDRFSAYITDEGKNFRISYNEKDIACQSSGSTDFAVNFYSRCPMGRGFAGITLSLLHELGHICTNDSLDNWTWKDRQEYIVTEVCEKKTRREKNFSYFEMPDETAATDWAIEWLKDPENRKKAKAFEKQFFACLKKVK